MTRPLRRALAPSLLLTLILTTATPARAAEGDKEEGSGGFVMGYMAAGVFVCAMIYAVCKPTNRSLNTPKPGSTGPGAR